MILFESLSFTLRSFNDSDAPSFAGHANDPDIARFMSDQFPYPYTLEQAKRFVSRAVENPNLFFAIVVQNEAVGGIGIHPLNDVYRKNAELGYWIAKAWQGRGIVSASLPKVCAHAFEKLDLVRIFARPFGTNAASQRVLEKSGFQLETRIKANLIKNGIEEDELIYSVRKPEIKSE